MRLIYLSLFSLGAVLLSYLVFIFVPNAVPSHRINQALFFELLAILFAFVIFILGSKSYKRLFLFCMLLIPLIPYFGTPLYPIGGPAFTILPEMGIWVLIALGLKGVKRFPSDFINRFLLGWIIISTLTLLSSVNLRNSVLVYLVGVLGPSIYLFILHNQMLLNDLDFKDILRFFIYCGFVYVAFSLIMVILAIGSFSFDQLYVGRFGMELGLGRYSSGGVVASTIFIYPLLFYLMVSSHDLGRKANFIIRLQFWMISGIIPLVLSRGGLIVFLFCFFYFLTVLFHKPKRRGRHGGLTGRGLVFIMILLAFLSWLLSNYRYRDLLLQRATGSRTSEFTYQQIKEKTLKDARVELWRDAIDIFMERWILGVGFGNLREEMRSRCGYNFDAHNIFLNSLAEGGIGMGVLFVLLFIVPGIRLWQRRNQMKQSDKGMCTALFVGQTAYLVSGFTTGGNLFPSGEYFTGVYSFMLFTSIALQFYLMDQRAPGNMLSSSISKNRSAIAHTMQDSLVR